MLKLHRILLNLNITPELIGYKLILKSIEKESLGVNLYAELAKEFNTTPSCIERGLRYCIQKCDKRDTYITLFGTDRMINNNKFIATLRESIKLGVIDEIYSQITQR